MTHLNSLPLSLLLLFVTSSCTVMRKVENMVPEIPEIVLIGKKKAPASATYDPASLQADTIQDAAVLKFDVRGQTRRVVIQLYPAEAPITVANFQKRIKDGFYNGLAIHRVIPNYLIQTGDSQSRNPETRGAWGTGGTDAVLPAEININHRPGAVGMARLGDTANPRRQSSGSQFYIALDNLRALNGKYTVFGQVIQGYDTIQEIAEFPADSNDNPYQRISIKSAKLDRASSYRPEDLGTIKRRTKRKSIEEQPIQNDGILKRTWRRIW